MNKPDPQPALNLAQLAAEHDLEIIGDPQTLIQGVATLENANQHQLSFLANPLYRKYLSTTQAAAVIVAQAPEHKVPCALLVAADPYLTYARIAGHFASPTLKRSGVHPSAVVESGAIIGAGAYLGAHCVIESGASIGIGSYIGAGTYVGPNSQIGNACIIHPRVTIGDRIKIGNRVIIHPGAVIGADGFGLAFAQDHWEKVPQLGSVRIGDDCEIGANSCIDRGALEDTVLEKDVRLDNLVQIAHNVVIGAHTVMAGCAAVAGSTKIGQYCQIGGNAGIIGHLDIADKVVVTAKSLVTHSIKQAGQYSSGVPLQDSRSWRKNAVRMRQLDELARSIQQIKREKDNGQ